MGCTAPREYMGREETKMKFLTAKSFKQGLAALAFALPVMSHAGVAFFDPTKTSAPTKLSDMHIYISMTTKAMDTAVKYYTVNAALWSDAAHKDRWIILPPGKHITYVDTTDAFNYPDSTIFVKLFRHETTPGDTNTLVYWETRLLVKKSNPDPSGNFWYGYSYKWNQAGTEATLVDVNLGLDTTLFLTSAPHFRKWHYPTQEDCYACHRVHDGKRSVLGFYPAQLKRPTSTGNQVTDFFANGIFTGTQPTTTLGKRFRGINEGVPSGLSATERFKVIDTMARSYIAANCSGCHGNKGLTDEATGHAPPLNYDFYNLVPQMEFGYKPTAAFQLDVTEQELNKGDSSARPEGRWKFLQTLSEWGITTGTGTNFDMTMPALSAFPSYAAYPGPALVVPRAPAYSTVLFRQLARRTAAMDSGDVFRRLSESKDPKGWKKWIFKAKWGSKAWRDTLTAHGVTTDQVITGDQYTQELGQMPPLATYIPDTAAIKILGEWVTNYYTLYSVPGEHDVTSIHGIKIGSLDKAMPVIQNRQLIVPENWTGKAFMISLNGRSVPLASVGRNRYALPASASAGVYFFRVGDRTFKTSVMK